MLTIVFYSTNGMAAKIRARTIVAEQKGNYARCYDVAIWDNTPDKCDAVEIMPDVPGWQRDRITKVFGEIDEKEEQPVDDDSDGNKLKVDDDKTNDSSIEKKAVHRGGGRWFVMTGDEILSGPHDKAEASRLAGE